jgi:hypothetical protein
MASIRKEFELDVPAAAVWEALADFHNVHRRVAPGFVTDSTPDGDNARIVTFSNGSVVKETLVTKDAARRRLVYFVSSERISHHNASAEVMPVGQERCRFIWMTDVLPDAVAPYIDSQMSEGVKVMKRALSQSLVADPARQ